MAVLMLDDQLHQLDYDHCALLDGFVAMCPECGRSWASMPPVGAGMRPYNYVRCIEMACPAHGGSALQLFTANTCAYLPLLYGYLPRKALEQIILSSEVGL